jgi:hypothetical protein
MHCLNHKGIVFGILFFLVTALAAPASAGDSASDVSGAGMAADLLFVRPLAIATTAIGCVFFVASLPFTVWSGERIKQAGSNFVAKPGHYAFVRRLGDFGPTIP